VLVLVEGFYNTVKCPHQILACELIILTLCCACSLQMYQFPIGDSQQKRTYNNLDTLYLENAHDKSSAFPAIAIRHTVHQVNVGEFCPGEMLYVNVDLAIVHTLMRF
jgi:hypothetical protein